MSDSPLRPMRPIKRVPFVEEVLPIHGPHHARKAPHDPVRPCAGFGLDNPANAREFIHGFKQLQKEWPHLTPGQRKMRLQSLSHQQLKKSGVPGIPVVPLPLTGANYAQTDFNAWQINMPEHILNGPGLPDQTAREFAGALYHESRHAEQAYLVARRQAGIIAAQSEGGLTPEQQVKEMDSQLKHHGYSFAPRTVLLEAQRQPLHKGDAQEHCAQMMYDNFVGKDADHEDRAINLDGRAHQADIARKRYDQVLREEQIMESREGAANLALQKADDQEAQRMNDQIQRLPHVLSPSEWYRRAGAITGVTGPAEIQAQAAYSRFETEKASVEAKLQRAYFYTERESSLLAKSDTIYHNLPSEADAWDCGNTITALWGEN